MAKGLQSMRPRLFVALAAHVGAVIAAGARTLPELLVSSTVVVNHFDDKQGTGTGHLLIKDFVPCSVEFG